MSLQLGAGGYPLIDQFAEDDIVDLTFHVINRVWIGNWCCYHLAGSYADDTVGFDVEMDSHVRSAFDDNVNWIPDSAYRSGMRFMRSGIESDRLVAAIARLYGLDTARTRQWAMVRRLELTAIVLHQGWLDFESQCVRMKLLGCDEDPLRTGDYFESFFQIDLRNGVAYWNEKDSDYREPLLRGISK